MGVHPLESNYDNVNKLCRVCGNRTNSYRRETAKECKNYGEQNLHGH